MNPYDDYVPFRYNEAKQTRALIVLVILFVIFG